MTSAQVRMVGLLDEAARAALAQDGIIPPPEAEPDSLLEYPTVRGGQAYARVLIDWLIDQVEDHYDGDEPVGQAVAVASLERLKGALGPRT